MPVPTNISDLTNIATTNSPAGTESVKGTIDDYLRAHAAFISQLFEQTQGPSVALTSAGSVAIGFAAAANIVMTGTQDIGSFDTYAEGTLRWITFGSVIKLVHDGAKFILPGAGNIITASGDVAIFKSLGGGNWKCLFFQRMSGAGAVAASVSRDGYLTAADWANFNGKYPGNNPAGFISSVTGQMVLAALGYTPVNAGIGQSVLRGKALTNGLASNFEAQDDNVLSVTSLGAGAGGSDCATMQFIRPGSYGIKMGLRSDNTFCLGGYSMGTNVYRFTSDAVGNFSVPGSSTATTFFATSDERKKRAWQHLPKDFIKQLAGIKKSGLFTWRKGGGRGVGVGAQSLERILPAAVHTDAKGAKTVEYGTAAMVSAVELARALVDLEARFDKRLAALESA